MIGKSEAELRESQEEGAHQRRYDLVLSSYITISFYPNFIIMILVEKWYNSAEKQRRFYYQSI
jgi:hypothetical protein